MSDLNAWKAFATKEQIAAHEEQEKETRRLFRSMFPALKDGAREDDLVAMLKKRNT